MFSGHHFLTVGYSNLLQFPSLLVASDALIFEHAPFLVPKDDFILFYVCIMVTVYSS